MPKQVKDALSAVMVRQIKAPGRYADGNGLYLVVTDTGARMWQWRGTVHGRRRELGMGSVSFLSLRDARDRARDWRRIAHEGGDPTEFRDRQKRALLTFADAAERCWSDRIDGKLRSERSASVWLNALRTYAYPTLARRPITAITVAEIKAVLAPIWLDKPETARKVRQRLRTIFDWARASGHLAGPNPTEGVDLALPRQTDTKQHFAALPWCDLPTLWPRLQTAAGMGTIALQFAILTAARTGEVRGAVWSEIDLDAQVWKVPAERMKAGKEHRVPLSDPALAVLRTLQQLRASPEDLVFPSGRRGKPLSDMTLSAVLRRLDIPVTVHGFRSTFRDWAEDETSYSHEVKEAALAHVVKNRAEAAYRRTDLFEKRRALMRDWAAFVTHSEAGVSPSTS
jgi:integrase